MIKSNPSAISLLFLANVIAACSGGGGGDSASSAASLASANSIDDLNLAALNLSLPDSLTSSSSSLALASSSKEACEVGRLVGDGLRNLELAASLFCHLEVETNSIKFGTKYALELTDGDNDEIAIWIDDSNIASGVMKVSMCFKNELAQVVTISGVSGDSVKGSIVDKGSEDGSNWASAISFDLGFSASGTDKLYATSEYKSGFESFKQMISINIKESGVSTISASETGTWQTYTFNNAGAVKFKDNYGQALFTSVSSEYPNYPYTRRAYFDSNGNVVAPSVSSEFSSGGSLYVNDSDVPAALDSSFKAASFASGSWDCSTDETLVIDMSGENGAAHDACEENKNEFYEDCYGSYEDGETEADFDNDKRVDADDFNDID